MAIPGLPQEGGLYKNVVIIRHGKVPDTESLARRILKRHSEGIEWRVLTHDEMVTNTDMDISSADLVVVIGGDGTILRCARIAAKLNVPLLGVNSGRVGFISEIDADDAEDEIGWYLSGNARIEERQMLAAYQENHERLLALNDITIHRGSSMRIVEVSVEVDGAHLASYRGDGLLVATATGSTGYAMTLGGPVMDPKLSSFLIKPIAAHMSQTGGAVLPETSEVLLTVACEVPASLSADGIDERPVRDGDSILIRNSDMRIRFLRRGAPSAFWENFSDRLGVLKRPVAIRRRESTIE